jgi:high-affinity Fe2+/Pb2+ permease
MTQIRYIQVDQKPRSFLMQVVGAIVGLGVLVVCVVLGAFLMAGLLGFVLIAAAFVYGRIWWLRRQFQQAANDEFIETEYRVVDSARDRERRPD